MKFLGGRDALRASVSYWEQNLECINLCVLSLRWPLLIWVTSTECQSENSASFSFYKQYRPTEDHQHSSFSFFALCLQMKMKKKLENDHKCYGSTRMFRPSKTWETLCDWKAGKQTRAAEKKNPHLPRSLMGFLDFDCEDKTQRAMRSVPGSSPDHLQSRISLKRTRVRGRQRTSMQTKLLISIIWGDVRS